jgi:hypothetical protein
MRRAHTATRLRGCRNSPVPPCNPVACTERGDSSWYSATTDAVLGTLDCKPECHPRSRWIAALVTEPPAPWRALRRQMPGSRDRAAVDAQPDFSAPLTGCPRGGLSCRVCTLPTPRADPAVMSWPLRVCGGCGCRPVRSEAIHLVAEIVQPVHRRGPLWFPALLVLPTGRTNCIVIYFHFEFPIHSSFHFSNYSLSRFSRFVRALIRFSKPPRLLSQYPPEYPS